MLAILSDVHANLEALQAVMDDVERRNIQDVYCLGDMIGYGPDPAPCLAICRSFQLCLAGELEQFIANPIDENDSVMKRLERHHRWNRSQLTTEQIQYLSGLKNCHSDNEVTFAHGSPLDYVDGYLFPEHIYETQKMERVFAAFDGIFLCGHTHLPGVHQKTEFHLPVTIDDKFRPNGKQAVINVGSVGQPRDEDPRACYVIYDGSTIEFIRVEYDVETTKRKIRDLGWPPY